MKAIAFVIREVHFDWTSCHSSLPSVILIMADKFEMQCLWWGNASSYCRGKCNEQIGRCSLDGVTGGWEGIVEFSMAGCRDWTWEPALWKHPTKQILMLQITQSHSTGFAFCVEPFQQQNIWFGHIDLSPSAAAQVQDILKSSHKKQMSFKEKREQGILYWHFYSCKAEAMISSKINAASLLQNVMTNFKLCCSFNSWGWCRKRAFMQFFQELKFLQFSVSCLIK